MTTTPSPLHRSTPEPLGRIEVVLVGPSHPGNVGACARAMRVMGLRRLALVAPRIENVSRHPEALARASGATDVLATSRTCASLAEAVREASLVVGVSADPREFGPAPEEPDAVARRIVDELDRRGAHRVAVVFGPERTGLSIADVARCQRLCSIPGDPDYHSLNLAQAVQVVAYELRRASLAGPAAPWRAGPTAPEDPRAAAGSTAAAIPVDAYADQRAVEAFHEHLERALVAIGYLDPAHPKKLMPRLRRLFARTRLEREEIDLLRGICKLAEQAGHAARAAGTLFPTLQRKRESE